MLRSVSLSNFILFREKTEFKFNDPGAYFFIGQNGSGKSSVFEAVRRCLSADLNTSMSSRKESENTYAVCKFDIPQDKDDLKEKFLNAITVYSGILQLSNQASIYKYVVQVFNDSPCQFFLDCWDPKSQMTEELAIDGTPEELLVKQAFKEDKGINETMDLIEKTVSKHDKSKQSKEKKTRCHEILKQLDDCVVFTMAHRSIGPLQWSKSDFITKDSRDRNYEESQKRAEIIKWFLSEKKKHPKGVFHEDTEKEIFSTITDNANYVFSLENNDIKVSSTLSTEFLKTPEGIVEAKNFSLIMASKTFVTVLLEEPATGLNCQVIEQMRDCYLQTQKKKTILVTTHHPSFIAPWMLPRMWLFRRNIKGVDIYEGSACLGEDRKTPRILASDHLSKLLFARNVLFCEGDSDYFFLTQLRQSIVQGDELAKGLQELIMPRLSTSDRKERTAALASMQIIRMGGQGLKSRLANICTSLGLQHAFVVDKDVICNDNWKKDLKPWIGENAVEEISKIDKDKKLSQLSEENWEKCRNKLRDHRIFVWRDGALEDMLTFLVRSKQITTDQGTTGQKIRKFEWKEDIGKLEELEKCNVYLPVALPSDRPKTRKKGNKIYMDDSTSQEDIKNSVDIFLNTCISGISDRNVNDLFKFIEFLIKFCNEDTPVIRQK